MTPPKLIVDIDTFKEMVAYHNYYEKSPIKIIGDASDGRIFIIKNTGGDVIDVIGDWQVIIGWIDHLEPCKDIRKCILTIYGNSPEDGEPGFPVICSVTIMNGNTKVIEMDDACKESLSEVLK